MRKSSTLLDQPGDAPPGVYLTLNASRNLHHEELHWEVARGDASLIEDLEAEWNAICDNGQFRYPLFRPAVVRAWLGAFVPGSTVVVLTARQHGRLVALMPFVERTIGPRRLGPRWLRCSSNLQIPRMDVISSHEDPEQIAREMWGVLRAAGNWDVLQFDSVPSGGIAERVRNLAAQDGHKTESRHPLHHPEASPFISIPGSPTLESLIDAQRKSLRQQLRRDLRRLKEKGDVQIIETCGGDGHDRLVEAYQQFVELEDRSWKGDNGSSLKRRPAENDFFMNLIEDPDLGDHLRIHTLTCNGNPVAIAISLVSCTTLFGTRITFNNDFRTYSPGQLLILHQIYTLGQQGFDTLDLGGGLQDYKMAWTPATSPMGFPFIFDQSFRGRLAHAAIFSLWPRAMAAMEHGPLARVAKRVLR